MLSEYDLEFTGIFQRIKEGDEDAFSELYRVLYERLKEVAQKKIRLVGAPNQATDEDDIVDSVFMRFRRRAMDDYFSHYSDRKALWFLLVKITHDRVIGLARYEGSAKRDKSRTSSLEDNPIQCFEQSAEVIVQLQDTLRFLLENLENDKLKLREIARCIFEECPKQAIAEQTGVSTRTVERRIGLIKKCWGELGAEARIKEILN